MGAARKLAHSGGMIILVLLLLAPSWLGPAIGALARGIGAVEHVCACGMARGTCGCPACARLEAQRARGNASGPLAVLRATCDDDAEALPGTSVPPGLAPAALSVVASAPRGPVLDPEPEWLTPFTGEPPPTPPPRSRAL